MPVIPKLYITKINSYKDQVLNKEEILYKF